MKPRLCSGVKFLGLGYITRQGPVDQMDKWMSDWRLDYQTRKLYFLINVKVKKAPSNVKKFGYCAEVHCLKKIWFIIHSFELFKKIMLCTNPTNPRILTEKVVFGSTWNSTENLKWVTSSEVRLPIKIGLNRVCINWTNQLDQFNWHPENNRVIPTFLNSSFRLVRSLQLSRNLRQGYPNLTYRLTNFSTNWVTAYHLQNKNENSKSTL